MVTLEKEHRHCAHYFGERPEWLIVLTQNRDSSVLDQSNFASALQALGGESDTVAVERSGHFLCGWVEYLVVSPEAPERVKQAEEIRASLEDYPVLDESDYSEREREEYESSWNSYARRDYVRALRKRISGEYADGIAEDFSDDEILDALGELPDETLDQARDGAAKSVNWEYESASDGVSINVRGLVEKTDTSALIESCIEALWAERERGDIRKLGEWLGACAAEIREAQRAGIQLVSGFNQLMQGGI